MKHKILSVKCFLGQRRLSEFIYRWSEFFPINEKQCFWSNQNIDKYTCPSYIYKKTQVMKTILTLIFVLFIGVAAQAKNAAAEVKVETVAMRIVTATAKQEVAVKNENSLARLYMFKNSKVTKELTFATKKNKAKLA